MARQRNIFIFSISLLIWLLLSGSVLAQDEPRTLPDKLLAAVFDQDAKAMKTLLARGANPNAPNASGIPPLLAASQNGLQEGGHLDIIRLLLANGADPNISDSLGRDAIDEGCERGSKRDRP